MSIKFFSARNDSVPVPKTPLQPVPLGSVWQIFLIWAVIGAQSFGGGPTTQLLIRREMIEKRGWLTDQDYSDMWTLSNLVPGINLVAFSLLVGRKLRGISGAMACTWGMMLPSAAITTLLTVCFTSLQKFPAFQAMMHGVIPATVGITFVFVINFARPYLQQSLEEGRISFTLNILFAATAALLLGIWKVSAVLVLILAAIAGAILFPILLPSIMQAEKIVSPAAVSENMEDANN